MPRSNSRGKQSRENNKLKSDNPYPTTSSSSRNRHRNPNKQTSNHLELSAVISNKINNTNVIDTSNNANNANNQSIIEPNSSIIKPESQDQEVVPESHHHDDHSNITNLENKTEITNPLPSNPDVCIAKKESLSDKQTNQPAETLDIENEPVEEVEIVPTQQTEDSPIESEDKISDISDIQPPRLTLLSANNKTNVYIVGTAHFSRNSVQDVTRVIQHTQPVAVVVELCRERLALLTLNEEQHMEGNKNFSLSSLPTAISKQGIAHGLIYSFFLKMSSALTNKLEVPPGGEFRVAFAEAQKLQNCTVFLGDRSIRVTMARAVQSLNLWEKVKFLYQALSINSFNVTKEEIENFKDKDIINELMKELGDEFQGVKKCIIDERDVYLAHSIYNIARKYENNPESNIVAVVGIGHIKGIVQNWQKTTDEQVALINQMPKISKTQQIVCKVIKCGFLGLCCYALYKGVDSAYHAIPKIVFKVNSAAS